MFYELRVYHCVPGRMPALHKRFETVTTRLFSKHGIRQVGYFTDYIGPDCSNKLTYLLAWESLAERERVMDTFLRDPEWIAARAEYEREYGPIVARVENSILAPTAYSELK